MNVSIIGATGAVGAELVGLLAHSALPITSLYLFASQACESKLYSFRSQDIVVRPFTDIQECQADLVFLCTDASFSRDYARPLAAAGSCVIDLSDAFRQDPSVPLIIPEVNGGLINQSYHLLANPNCTTALIAVSLRPLLKMARIKALYISTYQAASGAGMKGLSALSDEIDAYASKKPYMPSVFPHPLHLNVIPKIAETDSNGISGEEKKVIQEIKKIFNQPDWRVGCTAVRVPVMRCHAASVLVACDRRINLAHLREEILSDVALSLVDNPEYEVYPMPLSSTGSLAVQVGRLRHSSFVDDGLEYFIAGDQLLKGAALNALQIAERYFHV